MATKNKGSTRYYSGLQERYVSNLLHAHRQSNSGAGLFRKGDCVQPEASLLIECKTQMTDKDSFTIKKDWISKNKEEAHSQRLSNGCIAIRFGPDSPNYFLIDEKLMVFLVEQLIKDNESC